LQKNSKLGLLGKNISYSLSPKIYNYWFKEHNINATYNLIDVETIDSNIFTEFKGFNITKPYKETILPLLRDVSLEVKFIKSVNLVIDSIGFNTDYLGLLDSYKYYNINFSKKNVLILGAGGAARALIYSLANFDCNIFIYNRTPEKSYKVIEDFKDLKIQEYKENMEFDIIFNATTLNFLEILSQVKFKNNREIIYYDLNYYHNKLEDFKCIDGLYMLLFQAKYNFEKFFGITPQVNQQLIDYIKTK
jgi:shikimate dehydrogenase